MRQFGILRQFAVARWYGRVAIQTLRADGTIMHDSRHLIGRAGGCAARNNVLNRRLAQRCVDLGIEKFPLGVGEYSLVVGIAYDVGAVPEDADVAFVSGGQPWKHRCGRGWISGIVYLNRLRPSLGTVF